MTEKITVSEEVINLWKKMSDSFVTEKTNWISSKFSIEKEQFQFDQKGMKGLEECQKNLSFSEIMIILVRGCHVKLDEMYPIDIFLLSIPESAENELIVSKISFHLDFCCQQLNLQDFCYLKITGKDDLQRQKFLGNITKITGDPTGRYMFDETVYDMRRRISRSEKKDLVSYATVQPKIPMGVKARQNTKFNMRNVFEGILLKEGGGRFSYSVKKRYHVLTADMKMKYFEKKNGKLKGMYSVMLSTVGKGYGTKTAKGKKKNKKGLAKILFGKGKKGKNKTLTLSNNVTGECWWYIDTARRVYVLCAQSEFIAETWLQSLELMGCRRLDRLDDKEEEEEVEGEKDEEEKLSSKFTVLRKSETTEKMMKFVTDIKSEVEPTQTQSTDEIYKEYHGPSQEEVEEGIKKALALEKFSIAAERDDMEGMKTIFKEKRINFLDVVKDRRASMALTDSMKRISMQIPTRLSIDEKKELFENTSTPSPSQSTLLSKIRSEYPGKEENVDISTFTPSLENVEERNRESFKSHVNVISELLNMGIEEFSDKETGWGFVSMKYIYDNLGKHRDEMLNQLIEHSKSNSNLDGPLMEACTNNYACIIYKLIEAGANVNFQNREGDTPLNQLAKTFGADPYIVSRFLLNHGADPRIKNLRGDNFLSLTEYDENKSRSYAIALEYVEKLEKEDEKELDNF